MKKLTLTFLTIFFSIFAQLTNANDGLFFKSIGKGWTALAEKSDPFESSKSKIRYLAKGDFYVTCKHLNFSTGSEYTGYDSFNFRVDIKYKIDDGSVVEKQGRYSTYLNGSDMVNDDRVFSFRMNQQDINGMKADNKIVVAGEFSGWTKRTLNLAGFTNACNEMCM